MRFRVYQTTFTVLIFLSQLENSRNLLDFSVEFLFTGILYNIKLHILLIAKRRGNIVSLTLKVDTNPLMTIV